MSTLITKKTAKYMGAKTIFDEAKSFKYDLLLEVKDFIRDGIKSYVKGSDILDLANEVEADKEKIIAFKRQYGKDILPKKAIDSAINNASIDDLVLIAQALDVAVRV